MDGEHIHIQVSLYAYKQLNAHAYAYQKAVLFLKIRSKTQSRKLKRNIIRPPPFACKMRILQFYPACTQYPRKKGFKWL